MLASFFTVFARHPFMAGGLVLSVIALAVAWDLGRKAWRRRSRFADSGLLAAMFCSGVVVFYVTTFVALMPAR